MANDYGTGSGGPEDRRRDLSDPFASGKKRQPRPTVPPPTGPPPAAAQSEPAAADADAPAQEAQGDDDVVESAPGEVHEVHEDEGPMISDADLELLKGAEHDLVAEYRDRAARAEAELENFRRRVERDRAANREAVVAEVIRSLLPVIDDLDRAESHGDLDEASPLALVAQKLRTAIARHGLVRVGEPGEAFDPHLHEALMQKPSSEVSVETIAAVIEPGYQLGDRLIRPAKVAVEVPE